MFLPDRYVKGTCPKCKATDQYGDNCEVCGTTYDTTDLIDPYSVLSGKAPVEKESEHYFFKVSQFEEMLNSWKDSGALQAEISNKLEEWFEAGLIDWDISRDKPYWGLRDSRRTRQVFLRLARRSNRLHGKPQAPLR